MDFLANPIVSPFPHWRLLLLSFFPFLASLIGVWCFLVFLFRISLRATDVVQLFTSLFALCVVFGEICVFGPFSNWDVYFAVEFRGFFLYPGTTRTLRGGHHSSAGWVVCKCFYRLVFSFSSQRLSQSKCLHFQRCPFITLPFADRALGAKSKNSSSSHRSWRCFPVFVSETLTVHTISQTRPPEHPKTVAELATGDPEGAGLAELVTGADRHDPVHLHHRGRGSTGEGENKWFLKCPSLNCSSSLILYFALTVSCSKKATKSPLRK